VLKGSFNLIQRSSVGQFSLTCHDLKPLAEVLDLPTAGKLVAQGTVSREDKVLRFSVTVRPKIFRCGNSEGCWERTCPGIPR